MENKKKLIIIIIIDIFLLVCFIVSFYIPARKVTIRKSAFEYGGAYLEALCYEDVWYNIYNIPLSRHQYF